MYVWEFRASCSTHDWRDSPPRPHVSQWPPLPVPHRSALRRPARPLRQTKPAVKKTTGPMKRCRCVKHLFYPLLRDCRPAENRRHAGASINLWPLVETYFPHARSSAYILILTHIPPFFLTEGVCMHAVQWFGRTKESDSFSASCWFQRCKVRKSAAIQALIDDKS